MLLQAEKMIIEKNMDKEYAGIAGIADFCVESAKLAFGDSSAMLSAGRVFYENICN